MREMKEEERGVINSSHLPW